MYDFLKKVVSKDALYNNMRAEFELDGKIHIGVYKGKTLNFGENSEYESIFSEEKLNEPKIKISKMRLFSKLSVFLFKTQIFEVRNVNDKSILFFKIPQKIYRVQRRKQIRIKVSKNGFFYLENEFKKYHNPDRHYFLSIDFSTGGLCIRSKKNLKINEKMLINFNIGNGYNIKNYESRVVRKNFDNNAEEFLYGIMFFKELNWLMNVSLYKTLLNNQKM